MIPSIYPSYLQCTILLCQTQWWVPAGSVWSTAITKHRFLQVGPNCTLFTQQCKTGSKQSIRPSVKGSGIWTVEHGVFRGQVL